jgi:hypothetical protein
MKMKKKNWVEGMAQVVEHQYLQKKKKKKKRIIYLVKEITC